MRWSTPTSKRGNSTSTARLNHRFSAAVAKAHDGPEASIRVLTQQRGVNVVIHPQGDVGFSVNLLLNGQPLTKTTAGEHVRLSGRGTGRSSTLVVSARRKCTAWSVTTRSRAGFLKCLLVREGLRFMHFHSRVALKRRAKSLVQLRKLDEFKAKAKISFSLWRTKRRRSGPRKRHLRRARKRPPRRSRQQLLPKRLPLQKRLPPKRKGCFGQG